MLISQWLGVGELRLVSHFASSNMREGVRLIQKAIGEGLVFFVTSDLVDMLERCGAVSFPVQSMGSSG